MPECKQCPQKVFEQNKYIFVHSKSMLTYAHNMDRDIASRNVGPHLRSILFATQHHFLLKAGYLALDDLNSEHIEILSILQIVQELLEGSVRVYVTLYSMSLK